MARVDTYTMRHCVVVFVFLFIFHAAILPPTEAACVTGTHIKNHLSAHPPLAPPNLPRAQLCTMQPC